jgi:hypothetical protein
MKALFAWGNFSGRKNLAWDTMCIRLGRENLA